MQPLVLLFFSNLFSTDMILIIIVALVLFGGDKLPEIARGLGKGIRDFKEASEGVKREINAQIYSYEEKKAEEAAAAKYQAEQNNPSLAETRPSVPGTAPVTDSAFSVNAGSGEHSEENKTEPAAGGHATDPVENKDSPVV
ncbi:MAG TPA: twin-arginine translocase TatA/TatE family subunit [Mucilaginibacter sp.]|jgi:sec-independent protein translocase protein TatA|nr:twin-arginine translocase TatA/TatE family subunit [Mucilaginibacter sp.]